MTLERSQTRCAIYTRKSSEEGLDQSFNSLHAQREACETAFWVLRAKVSKGELPAVRLFIYFCKHFKIIDPNGPNPQLKGLFDALMAGPVKTPGGDES